MRRTVRLIALFGSGTVLLTGAVLVVNQTAQVVQLATVVSPTFGAVTLGTLLATYAGLIGVPAVLVWRLPAPLIPPENDHGPEFDAHLGLLRARLSASPHLDGHDLSGREGVERALAVLDVRVNRIVNEAASSVFLATAVSQSGRLDGLLVVVAQSRMVWQIAHTYSQRPTPRDLMQLYANVAVTAFVAAEIQEIDLHRQVEPVLTSALGALGASVPGFQVAGTILVNSVMSGSADAFLTLRVGMIAKRHCAALVVPRRATLRRAATIEAAQLLSAVVADGTGRISRAVWRASVGKVSGAVADVSTKARGAGTRLIAKVRGDRFNGQPEVGVRWLPGALRAPMLRLPKGLGHAPTFFTFGSHPVARALPGLPLDRPRPTRKPSRPRHKTRQHTPAKPLTLAEARFKAATKQFNEIWTFYRQSRSDQFPVYYWSKLVLESQQDLSAAKADQITALEAHFDRMKRLETLVKKVRRIGFGFSIDVGATEYYRLEAERWLEKARA